MYARRNRMTTSHLRCLAGSVRPHIITPSRLFSMSSMLRAQQLQTLKRTADLYPYNAAKQLPYYQALVKDNPAEAVQRYQSGRYAVNAEIGQLLQPYTSMQTQQQQYGNMQQPQQASYMPPPPPQSAQYTFTQPPPYTQQYQPQYEQQQQSPTFLQSLNPFNGQQAQQQAPQYALPGTASNPVQVQIANAGGGAKDEFIRGIIRFTFSALLIGVVLTILGKQVGSIGGSGMFKEPKAAATTPNVKFSDVKGCDEAKADLEELVAYLRNPEQFSRLGGKMPRGVLMLGPPGTGKTLLAKAVAGEANVPFFACSGSEFEEMYVGVGARRIRDLFAAAKKKSPAIIFIDEIDAVGGKRQDRETTATRMSLNQLLTELDGFNENSGIVVIGATNTPKMLDPALMRPGRFDKHVVVPLPDMLGRKAIIELYAQKVPMASDVSLEVLARGTPGCSGADLAHLINSAAIRASANNQPYVTMQDLEYARDKVLMGAERSNIGKKPETLRLTAFHETGHALVALYTPGAMPLHKATILPRGQAAGLTMQLPEGDIDNHTKKELLARMDVCMGGRVAEELVSGADNVTTGASSDLEKATKIARGMIINYGMGQSTGLISIQDPQQEYYTLSPDTKRMIDGEVQQMLEASYKRAKNLLLSKHDELNLVATELLKHETLSGEEIKKIVAGKPIAKDSQLQHKIPTDISGAPLPTKLV